MQYNSNTIKATEHNLVRNSEKISWSVSNWQPFQPCIMLEPWSKIKLGTPHCLTVSGDKNANLLWYSIIGDENMFKTLVIGTTVQGPWSIVGTFWQLLIASSRRLMTSSRCRCFEAFFFVTHISNCDIEVDWKILVFSKMVQCDLQICSLQKYLFLI